MQLRASSSIYCVLFYTVCACMYKFICVICVCIYVYYMHSVELMYLFVNVCNLGFDFLHACLLKCTYSTKRSYNTIENTLPRF